MTTDFEDLVRDSMQQFAAGIGLPADLVSRARRRHRRRRFAQRTAVVAVTAAVVAAAVTGAGAVARTPRLSATGGGNTGHLHALTAAYVVRRVSDALANTNLVLQATASAAAPGGQPGYFEGQQSSEWVTWYYQGHISEFLYGLHSQPQTANGTALVDGKFTTVDVDYVKHEWYMTPGINLLHSPPSSACTNSSFLPSGAVNADWPSMIRSSLACGAYKTKGYVNIGRMKTIEITGSVVMKFPDGSLRIVRELFVNPKSFLPARITQVETSGNGGTAGRGFQFTTDIQWLKATPVNTAKALVTIPAGYLLIPLTKG